MKVTLSSRTVAVLTSTRADAGPLVPVIGALARRTGLDTVVIATGSHLDARRGHTVDELVLPDATTVAVVDMGLADETPRSLIRGMGRMADGVGDVLENHEVDILLMLGDRWELLGAAGAALLLQVPIAHLHGGEVTEGALDERVRHAVSKLADLHFCAADAYRLRLLQMGEEAWRIHVTGAPALDRFVEVPREGAREFGERIGAELQAPWGLVTYHPPTVDRGGIRSRARDVFEAAIEQLASVVVTYPGLDPGGEVIIEEIERLADLPDVTAIPSLGAAYPNALASADVMVGNSSSGLIEAASFCLPVVNVGERQEGRIAPANVIHVGEDRASVTAGIERALDPTFRSSLTDLVNPYGDGHASERIVDVLEKMSFDNLARKSFVDIGDEA